MLRKTVLARALSIAFSGAALSTAIMQPATAQSNAAGNVYGKVAPGSATSVVIRNLGTNQTRTLQVSPDGTFTASAMAIGRYSATLQGGSAAGQSTEVDVIAGQGVEAVFASSGGTQTVQVTGRRNRIDVTNAANGATFTARELERLPIGKNIDSIIQLAPNTTRSDPTYIAGASIGGGGPSENSYYINGIPVTNPLTQLGASELPFGAIAQAEIKTGGYGAEFGRSVGGVINIVGKSGTNNWEVGGLASINPKKLRSDARDIYFPESGLVNSGKLRFRNQENEVQQRQLGLYVGGPIIKDKLFMFAAVEQTDNEFGTVVGNATLPASSAINGYRERDTKIQRYYAKLDYNITDNHRLEFTAIGDTPKVSDAFRGYDFATSTIGSTVTSTRFEENGGNAAAPNGGETQGLRYIGTLTDNFTVTGMVAKTKVTHIIQPGGYDPNMPGVTAATENRAPGLNYTSPQNFTGPIAFSGATDEVDVKRIDLEYKLGRHTLRAGWDDIEVASLNAGTLTAGGWTWIYGRTTNPAASFGVPGGSVPALAGRGPLADQGYYVNKNIFRTASNAYAGQNAIYLEDQWKITKDLLLAVGVRSESFWNANSAQVRYLEQKNIITPRVSAVWDVNGDASMKVFASAGRYTVPMPTVVALRGANGSLNTSQYYAYTGTDQNGQPTGLTQLTEPLSANQEFGQPLDPKTVASTNLKPSHQDEITLGFEQAVSPSLNWGAKATYRSLGQTIDDFCDGRPFRRYALDNNIAMAGSATFDPARPAYPYFHCAAFNPGTSQDFLIDFMQNGNYQKVTLSAAQLGFEKVKRVYAALDLFAEHPFRNGWYGRINYTLGRSTGNTEGQTLSDLNTGQADVAATTTWDYAELMRHANGLLPNDRKHQIKAFGFYEVTPEWIVGANLSVQSGRPKGCLGGDPNPKARADWQQVGQSPNYGVEHYCFGVASAGKTSVDNNVPAPRGTMGRLPWTKSLDMNLVYRPTYVKGLALKLDVFNVFDTQEVLKYNEQYNSGSGQSTLYGGVASYQGPRSMRLSAEYNHRF